MDSCEMSFQGVLIQCPSSASDNLPASVTGQFPESSPLPTQVTQSLNGLLSTTIKNM